MWLIVPYKRDRRWAGRKAQGRYCLADDATQDGWREIEVLGNYSIVVATQAAGQAIGALTGVERIPRGMTLADTLGELTLQERAALRDIALTLGYSLAELRAQFGQQVDLSSVRVAQFLNFLRQRRVKPRYDEATDEIVFDGVARACEPLQIDVQNAFPTTAVLDDFNRASLGGDWAGSIFGGGSGRIVSSTLYGPATDSGNQYSGNIYRYSTTSSPQTYGPDCEVYYTITTDSSTEGGFELLARADVTISPDCYSFFGNHGTGTSCSINRYDNGSFTQLGASITQGMSSGDAVGLECISSTIQAYRKPSGGSWGSLGSRTDSTYTAAGYLAVEIQNSSNNHRFDDFGGGTISSGSAVSGAAVVNASSSTTAVGWVAYKGAATVNGSSTVTSASSVARPGAATINATSTVTALGGLPLSGAATVAATSTVTALGGVAVFGAATVNATSSVTALGGTALYGAATVSGSSSVTVAIGAEYAGSATVAASSSTTAVPTLTIGGSAQVAGASTVTAGAVMTLVGAASIVGSSSITARGSGAGLEFGSVSADALTLTSVSEDALTLTSVSSDALTLTSAES